MFPYLFLAFLSAGVGFRTVEVDASRVTGKIRSFQGVVAGPLPLAPGNADLTKQYKDLRIDFVRADGLFGPVDIDSRWPDPERIAAASKTLPRQKDHIPRLERRSRTARKLQLRPH